MTEIQCKQDVNAIHLHWISQQSECTAHSLINIPWSLRKNSKIYTALTTAVRVLWNIQNDPINKNVLFTGKGTGKRQRKKEKERIHFMVYSYAFIIVIFYFLGDMLELGSKRSDLYHCNFTKKWNDYFDIITESLQNLRMQGR